MILVRFEESQTLLRITPLQNLDRLLADTPCVHVVRIRHVEINCIPPGQRPAVIVHAINLPG